MKGYQMDLKHHRENPSKSVFNRSPGSKLSEFGKRLYKTGLTQVQFSIALGVSHGFVSHVCTGRSPAPRYMFEAIEEVESKIDAAVESMYARVKQENLNPSQVTTPDYITPQWEGVRQVVRGRLAAALLRVEG